MSRKPFLQKFLLMGMTLGSLMLASATYAHDGHGPSHDKWKNGKGKKKGHYKNNHNHNARYEDGRYGRGNSGCSQCASCDDRRYESRRNDRRYERRDDGRYERRDDRRVDGRVDPRTKLPRKTFPGIFEKRS